MAASTIGASFTSAAAVVGCRPRALLVPREASSLDTNFHIARDTSSGLWLASTTGK